MSEASHDKDNQALARAKAALGNQDNFDDWRQSTDQLTERMAEAAKNLISEEQKQKQAAAQKAKSDRMAAQKKLAQLEESRQIEEERKRRDFATAQAERDHQAEVKRQAEVNKVIESQSEIDRIKNRPGTNLSSIKTFTRDVGAAIKDESLSAAQIAQNQPRPNRPKPTKTGNYSWLIGFSVVLILGSLILSLWTIIQKRESSLTPNTSTRTTLLTTDRQIIFELEDFTPGDIFNQLKNLTTGQTGEQESLLEIILIHQVKTTTDQGLVFEPTEITPTALKERLGLNLPNEWLRFLDPKIVLGLHYGAEVSPFYLFQTDHYENVTDAWLKEEKRLTEELLGLFDNEISNRINDRIFQDKMIRNYDTRILLDENNQPIALTAWLDQKTFLLTTSETAFLKIINVYSN